MAALIKLRQDQTIGPDERVVVVSTAHGLKFTGSKAAYHAGELGDLKASYANPPVELPATVDAVMEVLGERHGLKG